MARIPNGILGEFIGTAGNVSGYMRYGNNFLRAKRRKSANSMTPRRLAQQQKITICNAFTKPFAGTKFFNKTFPAYGNTGSGYNRATSALMNRAVIGSYPDTSIDYSLVLISKGPLPEPVAALATINAQGNIQFTWANNAGTGTAKATDKVVLLAYFIDTISPQIIYATNAGNRQDGMAILEANGMHGFTAETWIGFLSDDGNDASDSVYTGRLLV